MSKFGLIVLVCGILWLIPQLAMGETFHSGADSNILPGFPKPGVPKNSMSSPAVMSEPAAVSPVGAPLPVGTPLIVAPITFLDINSGRFGKLEVDIEDGQFLDVAVAKLHLSARNLDMRQGQLESLGVSIQEGVFQDFTIDRLVLTAEEPLIFDPSILLTHRILQFNKPAKAKIAAFVSQESLNRFANSPRVLERLSISLSNKVPLLGALLGSGSELGLSFGSGKVSLLPDSHILVESAAQMKLGQANLSMPLSVDAQLTLEDGWLRFSDAKLLTSGNEISPELSRALLQRFNNLTNWGSQSDDIKFRFDKLKVLPGKRFELSGSALINRLRLTTDKTY